MAQELYELPQGWEWKLWLEVLEIINGRNQKDVVSSDGEFPIIGSGGEMGRASASLCPPYSTVVGRKGTINKPFYVQEPFWNVDTAFGITPKEQLLPKFLFYFCSSFNFLSLNKSTTLPSLAKRDLHQIQIPVPPLAEQERIVAKLDALFSRIDQAIAQLQHTQAQTKALFASALDATFEELKSSQPIVTLGEIYDVRDGTHDSPKYQTEGYPLITSKNLGDKGLHFEKVKLISEEDYTNINKRSQVHRGDLLFAMIGTIGNPTIVEIEPEFSIKNVALFKPKHGESMMSYLRYSLLAPTFKNQMLKEAKGATQKFVGLTYLRQFKIPVPPLAEQSKIVAQLDAISERTQALTAATSAQLEQLQSLKASLLDAAFRGQLPSDQ